MLMKSATAETRNSAAMPTENTVRLLFVENDRTDVEFCTGQLKKEGFSTTADIVETREHFVEKVRANTYDLILADYRLPGWKGTETIHILKQMGSFVPVIVVTGDMSEENVTECLSMGATDLVLKGHLERLPVAIRRALREESMRVESIRAKEEVARMNEKLSAQIIELQRLSNETALMRDTDDLLQTCISAEEAYLVIRQAGEKLFPGESGGLCLLNASRNLLEGAVVWGDFQSSECVFAPEDCWAVRRARIQAFENPGLGLVCKHLGFSPAAGSLCVPVVAQGESLGVLQLRSGVLSGVAVKSSPEARQDLASRFAERVAMALANLKLRETLRSQSVRDPLTGLFNRRYMQESFEREVRRAVRNNRPICAIMLDIDHFKDFNDAFGHEAGDTLLSGLGALLRSRTRAEDIVCRYGGEEFILILPEAPLEFALKRAEDLRERARNLQLHHRSQSLDKITFSMGIASYPEHSDSTSELIRIADAALYFAKAQGRDRIVVGQVSEKIAESRPVARR